MVIEIEYYAILGTVVACLISVVGVYISIKRNFKAEQKPLNDLNLNIMKLTMAIENMQEKDKVRDQRITKHGEEIDELKETSLKHDGRIKSLEEWKNRQ